MINIFETKIREAAVALFDAEQALIEMNADGKQYDFCTNPNCDALDSCLTRLQRINKIYFQQDILDLMGGK